MADATDADFDPNLQPDGDDSAQPTSTGASKNANQQQAADRIVKRRNRRPVVCKPCRERRSKCSRDKPCSICVKRNEAHLCVYVEAPDKSGSQAAARNKAASSRVRQLDQLNQLEDLFKRYLTRDPASNNSQQQNHFSYAQQPTPAATDAPSQGTVLDPSLPPHWSSLFQQLRSSLEGYEDNASESGDTFITSEQKPVLLGGANPPSLSSVVQQYLPPNKADVDRRLNTFFGSPYIVVPIIHAGKFLNEYEDFWNSMQDNIDPVWLALLFAILSLSAHITASQGDEMDSVQQENWLAASASCLNIAGYSKPRPYLVAALLIFAQSLYMRHLDPSREVSLIISIATRLAYQSGLHREPGPLISPFEAEMRRRLWVMVRHFDCQVACQFGIPSSIQFIASDIQPPRNILDDDINETTEELPPSRPESDLTMINAFIMKNRYMMLFDEIYSQALNTTSSPDDDTETGRLEAALQAVRESTPGAFKPKPIALSLSDPDHLRMFRITLDFLYNKSLIILHRRRMSQQVQHSYSTCSNAAMSMINTFSDLINAFHPGNLMDGKAWMLSATTVNDFLLACMTLSMAVMTTQANSKPTNEEHLTTLETARNICADLSTRSRGAVRVLSALTSILLRSGRDVPQHALPQQSHHQNLAQPHPSPLAAYQPAQPYSLNGFSLTNMPPPPPSTHNTNAPFPSPTPSSALSQERTTSSSAATNANTQGQGQGQGQYAPLTGQWSTPQNVFLDNTPIMSGVFPSASQQSSASQAQVSGVFTDAMDPFERLTMAAAAASAAQLGGAGGAGTGVGPGEAQAGVGAGAAMGFGGVGMGLFGAGEVDWSAFDSFITED